MESLRLTPLDPSRPALNLLEDLSSGIHGCWLIYQECLESSASSGEQGDAEDGEGDEEPDDAYYEAEREELMAAFIEAVRAEAAERHDRLL